MKDLIRLAIVGCYQPLIEYLLVEHPENALQFGGLPLIYFVNDIQSDLLLPDNHPNKELLIGMFQGYLDGKYNLEILKDKQ